MGMVKFNTYTYNLENMHNVEFTAKIKYCEVSGIIKVDSDGRVFFCQDIFDGRDYPGINPFKYAWIVGEPDFPEYDDISDIYLRINTNKRLYKYLMKK